MSSDKEYRPERDSSSSEDSSAEDEQPKDEWKSLNGDITWYQTPEKTLRYYPASTGITPGPTHYAIARIRCVRSAFDLFITDKIVQLLCTHTNIHGNRKCENWRNVDEVEMRAFIGILILAGVFRSRHEATQSLWDDKKGRAIFHATMPLYRCNQISSSLCFDDKLTRPGRFRNDKLAAFRNLWEMCHARLALMFNPGVDVCVDEQLVGFKGRCVFRQYLPNKPAKYGIKIWVLCDVETAYDAWRMQIYTGKFPDRSRDVKQGMRVTLELSEGLKGHTITCDNFFTSSALAAELLRRKLALVGTIRQNKPELPPQIFQLRQRQVLSSVFAFTKTSTLVSYMPKHKKNVLLLSTKHREPKVSNEEKKKPQIILDYNKCKGAMDTLDKVIGTYSCHRKTSRWTLALFYNLLNVSAYNAFVLWTRVHPEWESTKSYKRRVFLEELGKMLVTPEIERRPRPPRSSVAAAIVAEIQQPEVELPPILKVRRKCELCVKRRTTVACTGCQKFVCKDHSSVICTSCRPSAWTAPL